MRKFTAILLLLCLFQIPACQSGGEASVSLNIPEAATTTPQITTFAPATTDAPTATPTPTPTTTLPPTPEPTPEPTPTPIPEVLYEDEIYHIFFHALIAFPEISYNNGVSPLDQDCVLVDEFNRVLQQLYDNNYALIDINETFSADADGNVTRTPVMVPEGKTPLILSVDDMVYDSRKMGTGMVDKLILDENGKIASYTKHKDGTEVISYDNEVVTVLENFIAEHPDFSVRGARGMLAMTGFAGLFGYRTDSLSKNREEETEAVKPIVDALRNLGWTFGCHGYGHADASTVSYSYFVADLNKWEAEVAPIIGKASIYIYPYGHYVTSHGDKYQEMVRQGYRAMCAVSHKQYWTELGDALYMTRLGVDGYSLRNYRQYLLDLFDCDTVIDTQYRR
ncbi:polysaccharide deacetylase family protein [Clostridia bacterium]|nr:polysaccharide deacetylase family protein [Clostridia bacterium]